MNKNIQGVIFFVSNQMNAHWLFRNSLIISMISIICLTMHILYYIVTYGHIVSSHFDIKYWVYPAQFDYLTYMEHTN